ncbi:TRAP transporter TatT component family protein [candidate division KSB1 bacterium]
MFRKIIFPFFIFIFIFGCSVNKIAINATGSIIEYGVEALMEESDLVFAEKSAPANLKLLEGVIKGDPENGKLLLSAAKGFAAYAMAFLEDEDKERAKLFYERGKDYGLRILLKKKQFRDAYSEDLDTFNNALKSFGRDDVPALFWTGFSWGNWINLSLDSPEALVDFPKMESIMKRVLELDETYYYGGVHLFFGTLYGSRPRMFGGNIEKAKEHFDKSIEISKGKFLLNYVYKASFYAVPNMEKTLFESLLKKVINAQPDILPEQRLVNEVAKAKAEKLLVQIDEYF